MKTYYLVTLKKQRQRALKYCLTLFLFILSTASLLAQRQMELLNRGLVAVRTSTSSVYVGWRLFGTDPAAISFNVYRGTTKLNASPITGSTNYVDNVTTNSTYTVRPVINGVEQADSESASVWSQNYLSIPIQAPPGGTTPAGEAYTYEANDCSPADLDGDGAYEIVVKWDPTNHKDNAQAGYTGNVYIDAYKLNGTRLWRINLGRNIRAGSHYTQLMVYDLDGDGKAEVAVKTADGTVDGLGVVIGSPTADYRNTSGYVLSGPEFLTIFNGQTGAAMATTNYLPARGTVADWGDSYGNRVDRFISTIAYADGVRPSLIMGRGYYTRLVRVAWDWRNGTLSQRWIFDSNVTGNTSYGGQGNHQLTVGDTDGDGKDEVFNGSSAINDNGTGFWNNTLGHGDALHMSDMNPNLAGQELWQPYETASYNGGIGMALINAQTGAPIWTVPGSGDIGRGMAADIDPNHVGYELWGSIGGLYNCTGTQINATAPTQQNFGLWWDADLQRELLDGTILDKWNASTSSLNRMATFYNVVPINHNNGTKKNPCVSADLIGDWREEVVFRMADNTQLILFTTTFPATNRIYTLMHNPQYRCQVAQQNSAYNQPPHPSFYLGGGMATPPAPNIYLASSSALASGTYTITARHSAKRLDVEAFSTADGGNVVQWAATTGNNQKWVFSALGGGYYKITNVNSGKVLEVAGSSTADLAQVQQWTWTGGYNQQWQVNALAGGYYSIINRNSGKSLDILNFSTADGADIIQYPYAGTTNQQFTLTRLNTFIASAKPQIFTDFTNVESEANVYPNPSSEVFNIKQPGKFTYTLLDLEGKVIEQGAGTDHIMIGDNLTAGIYILQLKGQEIKTYKLIKK